MQEETLPPQVQWILVDPPELMEFESAQMLAVGGVGGRVQVWLDGPEQAAPPQDGDGLLQVRVWLPPEQADQLDQPPFTAKEVPPPQLPLHCTVWPV